MIFLQHDNKFVMIFLVNQLNFTNKLKVTLNSAVEEQYGQVGGLGQNLKMEKPKFPNTLILEHLKSHFIKPQLTKFLIPLFFMCFEINGLKHLKLTIWRFQPRPSNCPYYSNSSKNIFLLLKHHLFSINSNEFT